MKKYYIKDDDDQEYEVIETEVEETPEEVHDEGVEALSEEDIAALKMLASIADKLAALVTENEAPAEEPIEEEEVVEEEDVVEDEDEEFVEEKKEEVVDTCKKDSKSSFGALEKRTKANDEAIVDDISIAWAKRYGGK